MIMAKYTTTTTTTTKPYPTNWGRLHESIYQKPCLSPTHLSLDPS